MKRTKDYTTLEEGDIIPPNAQFSYSGLWLNIEDETDETSRSFIGKEWSPLLLPMRVPEPGIEEMDVHQLECKAQECRDGIMQSTGRLASIEAEIEERCKRLCDSLQGEDEEWAENERCARIDAMKYPDDQEDFPRD